MSRLVRCIEGHVFEEEKGPDCPICGAPTSFARASARAASAEVPQEPGIGKASHPAAANKAPTPDLLGASLSALSTVMSRLRWKPLAYGAVGLAMCAAAVFLISSRPEKEIGLPLPPGPQTFTSVATRGMDAVMRRLDSIAPSRQGQGSGQGGEAAMVEFPGDPGGRLVAPLGLSPQLINELAAAWGQGLAKEGDVQNGMRIAAAAAKRYSLWGLSGFGQLLTEHPQDVEDSRLGTVALIVAGNGGIAAAHYLAGRMFLTDAWLNLADRQNLAIKEYRLAAQLGHAQAIDELKKFDHETVAEGEYAVVQSYRSNRAAKLAALVDAARRGWPQAAVELGTELLRGTDLPPKLRHDNTAGVEWLRFAADRGNGPAMKELGSCYLNGCGVTTNPAEAFLWLYLALLAAPEQPDKSAIVNLITQQVPKLKDAQRAALLMLLPPGIHPAPQVENMLRTTPPRDVNPDSDRKTPGPKTADVIAKSDTPEKTQPATVPNLNPRKTFDDLAREMGSTLVPGNKLFDELARPGPLGDLGNPSTNQLRKSELPETDVLVSLGQTSDEVRSAYNIAAAPKPYSDNLTYLVSQGLSFYFNKNTDRLESISVQAPFKGRILGFRIGDAAAEVEFPVTKPFLREVEHKLEWRFNQNLYVFEQSDLRVEIIVEILPAPTIDTINIRSRPRNG